MSQDLALLQRRISRSLSIDKRNDRRSQLSPVVGYVDRDPTTGLRNMVQADGSIDRATKLDNANPEASPGWYLPGTIGFPAQISSRPV